MGANTELRVGGLAAAAGEKVKGTLAVDGCDCPIPVTLVNGTRPGGTVVVLGGVHGGEYAGIETAIRLAASLSPEEVHGRVVIAHPVNTGAFFGRRQYTHPADGKNLNRVFPGNPGGTTSERIAHTVVERLFGEADFVMDLHGGDLHESLAPFVIHAGGASAEAERIAEAAARATGLRFLLHADYPGTTIGAAAAMGKPSILIEIGQCGRWSEAEVETYLGAVRDALACLGVLEGSGRAHDGEPVRLAGFKASTAVADGCWYPRVGVGSLVRAGEIVGELRSPFSDPIKTYHAEQDGVVLVQVTSLAVGAGEPVFAIGAMSPTGRR